MADDATTVDTLTVAAKPLPVASSLRQASFRGLPFAVEAEDSHFGRRQALHEYPYRDTPWPEDMGRAARLFTVTGFLVTDSLVYGGGDVLKQRDAFIVALETKGPGTLVHPTLGELYVSVNGPGAFSAGVESRYFALQFSFVEAGNRIFPGAAAATKDATNAAAAGLDAAATTDFAADIAPMLTTGAQAIGDVVSEVTAWGAQAISLGQDASSLLNLGSQLVGPFGRYFNAGNQGFGGALATVFSGATTIGDLVTAAVGARASLASAVGLETSTAGELGLPGSLTTDLAAAAQTTTGKLLAASSNPGDSLRVIAALAGFSSGASTAVAGPVGDLHRRAAVSAVGRASAVYQPTSSDDAAAALDIVTGAIDAEITVAGNQGDDASFMALRLLRTAVVVDLQARGAALAAVVTVNFQAPLPSLVLANSLYRDASRADELVTEADPIHPLFMPLTFQALAA